MFGGALPMLVLVHLRLLGCVMTLPGLGERAIPVRLRVALALALTPIFVALPAPVSGDLAQLAFAGGAELAVGLVLGLTVRLAAMALSIAATAIASTSSLAQLIGGENEMAPHPVGNLFHLAGLAVLMALGFPAMVADYLAAGFDAWPLASLPEPGVLALSMTRVVAHAFGLGMVLASPFILGGFLYQAISGVIGKVMPALPVVFVGAPLAILLALVGLAVFTAPIIGVWADAVLDTRLPQLVEPGRAR
ncbi:type III secretion protein [Paracoccus suum]|uniref:Type III secretion protein n=2 Tax=Paracoccus suum TaxID=2259340 RepID=A0A344PNW2_9RHOB|nr:type III secretion protein [Paracoccus suum]